MLQGSTAFNAAGFDPEAGAAASDGRNDVSSPVVAVSLAVSGRLCSADQVPAVLAFARERAADLEWRATEIARDFPSAVLAEGARRRTLSPFRARGLSLLPHFASDPLSLVFVDGEPVLVDLFVHEDDRGVRAVEAGSLLNTQFAGPAVHREICAFLADLSAEVGCTLKVDDETGYAASRDEAALEAAFAAAWRLVRERLRADAPRAGARYEIGELPFIASDGVRREEFAAVDAETAGRIVAFESALATQWDGFGLVFDRSRASIDDLELAASDYADPAAGIATTPAAREEAANLLGAAFGRAVVANLGGHWALDDAGAPEIRDVGGVGLVVDPVLAAWSRLEEGPVHALTNHFATYAACVRGLGGASPATASTPRPASS